MKELNKHELELVVGGKSLWDKVKDHFSKLGRKAENRGKKVKRWIQSFF